MVAIAHSVGLGLAHSWIGKSLAPSSTGSQIASGPISVKLTGVCKASGVGVTRGVGGMVSSVAVGLGDCAGAWPSPQAATKKIRANRNAGPATRFRIAMKGDIKFRVADDRTHSQHRRDV